MTEADWPVCGDPVEMLHRGVRPLRSSRRRLDLFCVACVHLVWHLLEDEEVKRPFAWLADHSGLRSRPSDGGHSRELFREARALYDAHHRREGSVNGAAVHVAYDLWAGWDEYAFSNLGEYFTDADAPYRGALHEDPRAYLPAIMRDIFGNPFRPVVIFSREWRTDTAVSLARQMYDSREFSAMPILADALQDAGCENDDVLNHCRSGGPHVRGCWVVDLVLRKV